MSLLDKNLGEKIEEICYERQRSQIEKFTSDHMSGKFKDQIDMPWSTFSTPSEDTTSFTYGYFPSRPSHYIRGIGGERYTSPIISKNYVQCSYPILDEISLRLVRDNDYHQYPFIIHDYDGEYLPDFIKFVVSHEYVKLIGDDEIYSDRMNRIQIYLDNCPNLKLREDDAESIVFIRLS